MKRYDFIIVGSGLFGSVFAHEMVSKGYSCLVLERRDHVGGNVYCKEIEDIKVHWYGAHIFHTSDEEVWRYVNQFVSFNRYTNAPIAKYKDEIYNLPFNMNTFYQLWNVCTPQDAINKIKEQSSKYQNIQPHNLEEQALQLVGDDIYYKLIKGYTEKQWGCEASELPAFIIKRLPIRLMFDNNYFNDLYQGIPIEGYNVLIEKLLKGTDVCLNTDYNKDREHYNALCDKIIYTGMLDELYDYQFGALNYRSLRFEHEIRNTPNYQGNAVVNYTEKEIPYTRIIEHKHFEFGTQDKTVISKEYSQLWKKGDEAYYPVNNTKNEMLYRKYLKLVDKTKYLIGGRLAEYKYYDMDKVIRAALNTVQLYTKL
ncbi:MAG: UDP-galactopyranose mutase [Bacteroidia bacterium]|nr:UDP-galactopyranose mutase [Bacteroidia bacterium]